jgi:hypothetical protein
LQWSKKDRTFHKIKEFPTVFEHQIDGQRFLFFRFAYPWVTNLRKTGRGNEHFQKWTGPVARGRGWDVLFDSLKSWRKPSLKRKKEGKDIILTVLPRRIITVSIFKYFLTFIKDEMAFQNMPFLIGETGLCQ